MSKIIKTPSEMLTHILKTMYVAEVVDATPLPEPKDERPRAVLLLDPR